MENNGVLMTVYSVFTRNRDPIGFDDLVDQIFFLSFKSAIGILAKYNGVEMIPKNALVFLEKVVCILGGIFKIVAQFFEFAFHILKHGAVVASEYFFLNTVFISFDISLIDVSSSDASCKV